MKETRIVKLDFDNKSFAMGVESTLKSLDELNNGLELKGASRGLDSLSKTVNKFSLDNVISNIELVSSRFTNLGIMGKRALENIMDSVLKFGGTTVNKIMEPLLGGGTKRALNIQQAKFQFEGLGMDVKATMDSALEAVTGTAYGLDAAAKVASQLGASGMRAGEKMTSSLRGIAGLAAMTSSQYDDIGRIFTTVAGNGRLMGDQLLQLSSRGINAAAAIAKQLGTTEEHVRDMTSKGKISFEMFSEAMDGAFGEHAKAAGKLYSGALDNMNAAISRIGATIADVHFENMRDQFNASKVAIDAFHEAIKPALKDINTILTLFSDKRIETINGLDFTNLSVFMNVGGRDAIIRSLANSFRALVHIVNVGREAFNEIFPPKSMLEIINMTIGISQLTEKFKMGEKDTENLRKTFKGFFALLDIGGQLINAIISGIVLLFTAGEKTDSTFLSVTGSIGDFIVGLNEAIRSSGIFHHIIGTMVGIILMLHKITTTVGKALIKFFTPLVDVFRELFTGVKPSVISGTSEFLSDTADGLTKVSISSASIAETFKKIKDGVIKALQPVVDLGKAIGTMAKALRDEFMGFINKFDNSKFEKAMGTGILAGFVVLIYKIVKGFKALFAFKAVANFFDTFHNTLKELKGALFTLQQEIKANMIIKIAIAIGILAVSLALLSQLDTGKMLVSSMVLATLAGELGVMVAIFMKLAGEIDTTKFIGISLSMIALSIAIAFLVKTVARLGEIDSEELRKGVIATSLLMVMLAASAGLLTKESKNMATASIGLIMFAQALKGFVVVIEQLGAMDYDQLYQGLEATGYLLGGIMIFMITVSAFNMESVGISLGAGMYGLSRGIMKLAESVKFLGDLDINVLKKGMVSIVILLGMLTAFATLSAKNTSMIPTAIGMVILAGSIFLFRDALVSLSDIPIAVMEKGLTRLAILLGVLTLAMNLLPSKSIIVAAGLLVMGLALELIVGALKKLAGVENMGDGLMTLAKTFGILALAGILMAPLVPILIAIAGIMFTFSLALLMAGNGINAFADGLTILLAIAATSEAGITRVFSNIGEGVKVSLMKFAEGLILMGRYVLDQTESMVRSGITLMFKILGMIGENAGKFAKAGADIMLGFLGGIKDKIKDVTKTVVDIILEFVGGVRDRLPEIIQSATDLMVGFINGLSDSIDENSDQVIDAVFKLLGTLFRLIWNILQKAEDWIKEEGSELLGNLWSGMEEAFPKLLTWFGEKVDEVIDTVTNAKKKFFEAGKEVITGFFGGMKDNADEPEKVAQNMAYGVLRTVEKEFEIQSPSRKMHVVGTQIDRGLANGIEEDAGLVDNAMEKLTDDSKINDFLNSLTKMKDEAKAEMKDLKGGDDGKEFAEEVASGIEQSTPIVSRASSSMGTAAKSAFEKAVEWMDDRKYYGQLTLEQELSKWEELQAKYKEGTEERKKIDREMFRVKNELDKKAHEHSLSWIDDRKYYDQLSLSQELAAWQRVQSRYLAGTEERKKADREVYRLQKEITAKKKSLDKDYYDTQKELNKRMADDIRSLNKEYEDAVKSRADAIYNSYRLFDAIEEPEAIDGKTLVTNLSNQVVSLKEWQKELGIISKKGVTKGLIDELTAMGPSAIPQIKALNALSAGELDSYVDMWKEKHKLAKDQAVGELEGMRTDTDKKIKEIHKATKTELSAIKDTWKNELDILRGVNQEQLNLIDHAWISTMNNIKGIASGIAGAISGIGTTVAKASSSMAAGLAKITRWDDGTVKSITSSTSEGLREALDNVMKETGFSTQNPTIKPVLDLTNVYNGKDEIDKIMKDYNLSPTSSISKASTAASSSKTSTSSVNQNGSATPIKEVSFVQNNYSPKSLSRLDIYRQTNNQITALKGAVTSA